MTSDPPTLDAALAVVDRAIAEAAPGALPGIVTGLSARIAAAGARMAAAVPTARTDHLLEEHEVAARRLLLEADRARVDMVRVGHRHQPGGSFGAPQGDVGGLLDGGAVCRQP